MDTRPAAVRGMLDARSARAAGRGVLLLVVLTMVAGWVGVGFGQSLYYDRNKVPGKYTLGLYADESGQTGKISLGADDETLEVFIGITGDTTRVFSGVAFSLELPEGIELDGAIRWRPIEGLTQWGSPLDGGVEVEFNTACQEQTGPEPAIVGRVKFRVDPAFESGEIILAGHRRFGVSVELCEEAKYWPKPYATGLGVTVERKSSLWTKMKGLFD